jgi:hypothetical protein
MPKRISKNLKDSNQIAAALVDVATTEILEDFRSKVMAEMGRKGGRIGGKRSLETMTPAQRKKRATKAAEARWNPPKK